MNRKLLWSGVLGLAGVVVGLALSSVSTSTQADFWRNVVPLVRSALLIGAYSLMAMSGVKCAQWIYVIIALIAMESVFPVERLLGHSSRLASYTQVMFLLNSLVALPVWIVLACRNAGRLRAFFAAWSVKSMFALVMAIVVCVQSMSHGGMLLAGWPFALLRGVSFLSLWVAYFFWLYLIHAALPEEVRTTSEGRCVPWFWRVFLVTLPLVSVLYLGLGRNLLAVLVAPVGMTFGVGGPLLGGIVGWGAYLTLAVLLLRARRLSTFLSLLGALVLLVILNVVGCGAMCGGFR